MSPAPIPIQQAPLTSTNPAPGVTAARPATAPVIMPSVVGLPKRIQSRTLHITPAAAPATWVARKALTATLPALNALPALKPYHPNHNRPAPSTASGRLCGGEIVFG